MLDSKKQILFLGLGPILSQLFRKLNQFENLFSIEAISSNRNAVEVELLNFTEPDSWMSNLNQRNYDLVFCSWRDFSGQEGLIRKNILQELCRQRDLTLVYLSSVAVYGECNNPKNEESEIAPINLYGQNKLSIETFLRKVCFNKVIALRIANVFGNPQFKDFINLLAHAIMNDSEIEIISPNKLTRDFVSQEILLEILTHIVLEEKVFAPEPFNVLNIASGHSYSLHHIMEVLQECTNIEIPAKIVPYRSGVFQSSVIDNSKLRALLNFSLDIPLPGMQTYFRNLLQV